MNGFKKLLKFMVKNLIIQKLIMLILRLRLLLYVLKHGEFKQQPSSHLQGKGCIKCSDNYIPTTDEWIEEAIGVHGKKFDYSKTEYVKSKEKSLLFVKNMENLNNNLQNILEVMGV